MVDAPIPIEPHLHARRIKPADVTAIALSLGRMQCALFDYAVAHGDRAIVWNLLHEITTIKRVLHLPVVDANWTRGEIRAELRRRVDEMEKARAKEPPPVPSPEEMARFRADVDRRTEEIIAARKAAGTWPGYERSEEVST